MIKKISIFLMIIMLLSIFSVQAFATDEDFEKNTHGFGHWDVYEEDGQLIVSVDTGTNVKGDQDIIKSSFDSLFSKYGKVITYVTGIITITLVIIFIYLCIKCAFMATEHWFLKRQTMIALLWVGIAAALLGSTTLILLLFQNAFI